MYGTPDLRERLVELSVLSPAERSSKFETLIEDLFKRGHFRTERKSRAAGPRQIDLVASRRSVVYLIEVKWESEPVDVGGFDGLYGRLDGTPPATTGVVISPSGFTLGFREEVVRRKHRPVLLVGPEELLEMLHDPRSVAQILRRKFEHFHVTGEVLVGPNDVELTRAIGSRWRRTGSYLIDRQGERIPWVSSSGGYGQFVFAQDLADVDWVPGGGLGVHLDLRPTVYSQQDLVALVNELAAQAWLGAEATWVIEQINDVWHGIGWTSFVDAVTRWQARYGQVTEIHHTEQFCITDSLDGRLLVLSGDLSAGKERDCRFANLSFQLQGIPLDPEPFTQLAETVGDDGPTHLRPLSEKSVRTADLRNLKDDCGIAIEPIAFVVDDQPDDNHDPVWVRGIVIANPFGDEPPEGVESVEWPHGLRDSELVVCSLGQWHPWGDIPERYELRNVEWARTTEYYVVRVVGDWEGELTRADGSPRLQRRA